MVEAKQWLGHNINEIEAFCKKLKIINCAQMFITRDKFKYFNIYLDDKRLEPYDFIVKNEHKEFEIKSEIEMYKEYEEVLS